MKNSSLGIWWLLVLLLQVGASARAAARARLCRGVSRRVLADCRARQDYDKLCDTQCFQTVADNSCLVVVGKVVAFADNVDLGSILRSCRGNKQSGILI